MVGPQCNIERVGRMGTLDLMTMLSTSRVETFPMPSHLLEDHPTATALERQGAISFKVLRTFEKHLERQVAGAVAIQNCKAEWEQPAVERLIVTRDLPDQDERRGGVVRGTRQRVAQQ